MADVELIIGPEDNPIAITHATCVDENRKMENGDTTVCFDEVVQEGASQTSFEVSVDRLNYDSMDDYIAIDEILEDMVVNPGVLTIREVISFKDEEPYLLKRVYLDVLLADDKYKIEPNKKAVSNLIFNCGKRVKEPPVRYNG